MPSDQTNIGTWWLFKLKGDGRNEVRYIVEGWKRKPGIDCRASSAQVCRMAWFKIVLAISAENNWRVETLDVLNPSLHVFIDGHVCIEQPGEFEEKGPLTGTPNVFRLERDVTGRGKRRRWGTRLSRSPCLTLGPSKICWDPCLCVKGSGSITYSMIIYLENARITSSSTVILKVTGNGDS